MAMQDDAELTAVVRSRQLHIYRNGKTYCFARTTPSRRKSRHPAFLHRPAVGQRERFPKLQHLQRGLQTTHGTDRISLDARRGQCGKVDLFCLFSLSKSAKTVSESAILAESAKYVLGFAKHSVQFFWVFFV